MITVPLCTAPPKVWQPDRSAAGIAELTEAFRQHEWSSGFGGVCVWIAARSESTKTAGCGVTATTLSRGPACPSEKP